MENPRLAWFKTENEDLKEAVARLKAKEEKFMTLKFEYKQLKGELAVTKEHCVKISNSLTEATEKNAVLEHDLAEAKAKQEEKEVIREIVKEVPVEKVVYKDRPEVPEDYIHPPSLVFNSNCAGSTAAMRFISATVFASRSGNTGSAANARFSTPSKVSGAA